MARALPAGVSTRRRRAFFGLLDADGWGWAAVKAFLWFVLIIFLLGYIPDRAYYLTVNRTLDLGILAWSPVNLCPASNGSGYPCPPPVGAVLPWESSPPDVALPEPRTDGGVAQAGTKLLYIGGTDGTAASDEVFVAQIVQVGNFDRWQTGPALPEPRADAAVGFFGGSIYVVGGLDENGDPTDTAFVLTPNLQTGELGEWQTAEQIQQPIDLPAPRAGGSLVALGDGLLFVGGAGPDGPSATTWKSKADRQGKLGKWTEQAALFDPVADGTAVLNGDYVWLYGGRNAAGPVGGVQRGTVATSGDTVGQVTRWATGFGPNLPVARTNASGFFANGTLYLAGGTDGSGTKRELYWAVPQAGSDGDRIPEWKHLGETNLPGTGVEGAAVGTTGPNVFLIGGQAGGEVRIGSLRSNLAPQEPFFQLGLLGMTIPALKIDGQIGQELGYLNAAGAGTVNFIILLLIGWLVAHPERTRRLRERVLRRRRR